MAFGVGRQFGFKPFYGRVTRQEVGAAGPASAKEPSAESEAGIGPGRSAPDKVAGSFKRFFGMLRLRAELQQDGRQSCFEGFFAPAWFEIEVAAVLDELGWRIADRVCNHDTDCQFHKTLVDPAGKRHDQSALAVREQGFVMTGFSERAGYILCVAIDVGAKLHDRRASVAGGHWHQQRFWWDTRNLDRRPGRTNHVQCDADLVREGGRPIMVEKQI